MARSREVPGGDEGAEMLAVRCPQVTTGRGERLVGERRIVGMENGLDGFVLVVRCPCGSRHDVRMGRTQGAR